ncbi:unnamed protein product [marine sediment metagenome]|uniref:Uncharacterized protein n=1 Tax=marine sediment metagenome TaxID=412755 RepID=X1KY31_9ZZZZ
MSKSLEDLEAIARHIRSYLITEDEARENALRGCRQVVQHSARAIRALHCQEQDKAKQLLDSAYKLIQDINLNLSNHGELLHSGFVHDAQKEFAEACLTLALINKEAFPEPEKLGVSYAAYLNGLGEAVGELRRYILDGLRRGDFSRGEGGRGGAGDSRRGSLLPVLHCQKGAGKRHKTRGLWNSKWRGEDSSFLYRFSGGDSFI